MMDIEQVEFIKMSHEHAGKVMRIYNYYIENSFAAYAEQKLPVNFFDKLLETSKGYPAYVIKSGDDIIGFCLLRPYHPFPTFKSTAEITYFIDEKHSGKGLGKMVLDKLTDAAGEQGITTILASVSSKNPQSLSFHRKHGFSECGRFRQIGRKFGETFDIIWFSKQIQ
ncbi:MAG: GNAT family N-acetyltransferase [Bacteroidales bacterium]|jgi:phosphinothricin acetyltransferase|nr:GNAT family N-acetyltransferase [Bacteroidales bacterium]